MSSYAEGAGGAVSLGTAAVISRGWKHDPCPSLPDGRLFRPADRSDARNPPAPSTYEAMSSAVGGTRTLNPLRALAPQASAYTENSATTAQSA